MSESDEVKDLQAPHVKWTRYVGVAIVLGVITSIEVTIALGHFLSPELTGTLLILLALTKAALVMAFYMHLRYDTRWYSLALVFPLFMVVILFSVVIIAVANAHLL